MDPISAIIIGLIWAALRAPGEAGRSMRQDYRNQAGRWNSRAENWMNGRRGGRRVAGYDRDGRAYRRGDRNRRGGGRRGDPGWRTDPGAWTGPEGRARVARGVRPSAIRSGIVAGALAYTAVFGIGVAASGFRRGLVGGYRMGRLHYLGKRNQAQDPTTTVTPGAPGDQPGPDDEVVDAVIVEDPNTETPPDAAAPDPATQPEPEPDSDTPPAVPPELAEAAPEVADLRNGPWLLIVHGPGVNRITGGDSDGFAVYDAADLDRRLNLIAGIPGLTAEVKPLPDPDAPQDSRPRSATGPAATPGGANVTDNDDYEWQCPCGEPAVEEPPVHWTAAYGPSPRFSHLDGEPLCPVMGANGYEPAQPEPRDPRPSASAAGPTNPGGTSMSDITPARTGQAAPINTTAGQFVPVGTSISAPVLMEGANYHAHLHNLQVIAREAQHEYHSAELTLASASAARQRAEYSMAAVEQMAAGLAAQDFGAVHVGNMASLHELLARHVEHARTAERAAQESLATSEQLIQVCLATAAAFQRDHAGLAEAHASAPHAAKTREAYQPM